MKVQCDVCGQQEASVFCCADEAALCDACDRKVHRANKLAEKHRRFALLRPATSAGHDSPNCDVCQERRGYIFCQEDRAILCKECDQPIHSANDLTKKHNRFLLVGSRLSAHPISPSDDVSNSTSPEEEPPNKNEPTVKRNYQEKADTDAVPVTTAGKGSSISEYLTKECPGWHVDDLFIDDAAAAAAAATVMGNQMRPFIEPDFDLPIWVPQPSDFTTNTANNCTAAAVSHFQTPMMGSKVVAPGIKSGRGDSWNDDLFTVPQISPREPIPPPSKRSRPSFWYY